MARKKRYWLVKSEPSKYSIADLERDGTTGWEGVRNYQARNFIRDDMKVGDGVLFYASNTAPSGVVGVAEVSREAHPDPFQFVEGHEYEDAKSTTESPIWFQVELRFVEKFPEAVDLTTLKTTPGLGEMAVVQRGSRLSVQPVTSEEFAIVRALGRARRGSWCVRRVLTSTRESGPTARLRAGRPRSQVRTVVSRLPEHERPFFSSGPVVVDPSQNSGCALAE